MRLAVFGSETDSGMHFLKRALSIGFEVKLLISKQNLESFRYIRKPTIVVGSHNKNKILQCLRGCDAVVFLANNSNVSSIKPVLKSMEELRIARIVICEETSLDGDYEKFNNLSFLLSDSPLDWTIVKNIDRDLNEAISQIYDPSTSFTVNLSKLSNFLVDQISDSRHIGSTIMITT